MNTSRDFLNEGALIQTSPEEFKVFIGPFKPCSPEELNSEESIFYTTDFWHFLEGNDKPAEYFSPQKTMTLTRLQMIDFLDEAIVADNKSNVELIEWSIPSSNEFKQQYDWIQDQIRQGILLKALPIALQKGQGSISERLSWILSHIVHHPSRNYAYGFWRADAGVAGYTPEVLSSWNAAAATLQTMALAGTWKKNSQADFNDPKIKQEHEFVIQDIEAQLNSFSLKEKSSTEVVELPYLFHLKTSFKYHCQSLKRYLEAIHLLHPTAALGVYPRQASAVEKFSQFDLQQKRKKFGAPIGFFNAHEGVVLVGIRNIIWTKNQIELFAGCGVTKDSVFEDEWSEILAKQDSVKKMLGLEN